MSPQTAVMTFAFSSVFIFYGYRTGRKYGENLYCSYSSGPIEADPAPAVQVGSYTLYKYCIHGLWLEIFL